MPIFESDDVPASVTMPLNQIVSQAAYSYHNLEDVVEGTSLTNQHATTLTLSESLMLNIRRQTLDDPIQAVAYAFRAVEQNAANRPAVGMVLVLWGYHQIAYDMMESYTPPRGSVRWLHREWVRLLAMRRIDLQATSQVITGLLETADHLEDLGHTLEATACRVDAYLDQFVYMPAASAEAYAVRRQVMDNQEALSAEYLMLQIQELYPLTLAGEADEVLARIDELDDSGTTDAYMLRIYGDMMRGWVMTQGRQIDRASEYLQRALRVAMQVVHHYLASRILLDMARLHMEPGDIVTVYPLALEALTLAESLENTSLQGEANLVMGQVKSRGAELADAEAHLQEALSHYEAMGNLPLQALCHCELGYLAQQHFKLNKAANIYQEAFRLLGNQQHEAPLITLIAQHNMALLYTTIGDYHTANIFLEQADAFAEEVWAARGDHIDLHLLPIRALQTRLHLEWRELSQAQQKIDEMVETAEANQLWRDYYRARVLEGELYTLLGQFDEAEACFQQCAEQLRRMDNEPGFIESELSHAEAKLYQSQYEEARMIFERLRQMRLFEGRDEYTILLEAETCHHYGQDAEEVMQHYDKALVMMQKVRRNSTEVASAARYAMRGRRVFERALKLAVERYHEPHWALRFLERFSGQVLSSHLDQLEDEYDQLLTAPDSVTNMLNDSIRPGLNQLPVKDGTWGDNWTILRYGFWENKFRVFVIRPHGETIVQDCDVERVRLQRYTYRTSNWRRTMVAEQDGSVDLTAFWVDMVEFYNALIPECVRDTIEAEDDHLLVIIPTRELHGLPFQALASPQRGDDGIEYLIEKAAVTYARTLRHLHHALQSDNGQRPYPLRGLALSKSENFPLGYADAPEIDMEMDMLGELAHIRFARLRNGEVDVAAFRAGGPGGLYDLTQYDVLHIATHTVEEMLPGFDDEARVRGLFIGGRHEWINPSDIRALNHRLSLVALPDCSTGIGYWLEGDEVIDLAQAFVESGARSVLATQWEAAQSRTEVIMRSFYKYHDRYSSVALALAAAQREAIRDEMPLYYWAPFYILGRP